MIYQRPMNTSEMKYEICRSVVQKMLAAGFISQAEHDKIDMLNREKFNIE